MAVDELTFRSYMQDPGEQFHSPHSVASHDTLSCEQKLEILKSWKVDAMEMLVATSENMPGDDNNLLAEVEAALSILRS